MTTIFVFFKQIEHNMKQVESRLMHDDSQKFGNVRNLCVFFGATRPLFFLVRRQSILHVGASHERFC